MWNLFKKEKKITEEEAIEKLERFISGAKKKGYKNKDIMRYFLKKKVDDDLILKAFELNLKKEVEMKKKSEEDFDEEEFDEEEIEEDEDLEEEEEPKKKIIKEKKSKKKPDLKVSDILLNHEQRIANLEARLFRMLSV